MLTTFSICFEEPRDLRRAPLFLEPESVECLDVIGLLRNLLVIPITFAGPVLAPPPVTSFKDGFGAMAGLRTGASLLETFGVSPESFLISDS